MLKFAIGSTNFSNFFYLLLSLTTITGQQSFLSLGDDLLDRTFETKNGCRLFLLRSWKLLCLSLPFSVFLYDLFTNKARKLQSQIPSWKIFLSFFICRLEVLSFSFLVTLYHVVDAALQLLLCGVLSSSLILINNLQWKCFYHKWLNALLRKSLLTALTAVCGTYILILFVSCNFSLGLFFVSAIWLSSLEAG